MVISMTNRLLAVVIAVAFSTGIAAHAAQAPQRPLAPVTLTASDLPLAVNTTFSRIGETATGTVDPSGAIRDAYQRDHVALEHLRQQESQLNGAARPTFDLLISDEESTLADIERTALATTRPVADTTIGQMDQLVAGASAQLSRDLATASKAPRPSQNGSHTTSDGQSQHSSDSEHAGSTPGEHEGND